MVQVDGRVMALQKRMARGVVISPCIWIYQEQFNVVLRHDNIAALKKIVLEQTTEQELTTVLLIITEVWRKTVKNSLSKFIKSLISVKGIELNSLKLKVKNNSVGNEVLPKAPERKCINEWFVTHHHHCVPLKPQTTSASEVTSCPGNESKCSRWSYTTNNTKCKANGGLSSDLVEWR